MALRTSTVVAVASLLTMRGVFAGDATCSGGACEDPPEQMSILQIQDRWGCAAEGADPFGHGRHGRCCSGLTTVQGQFHSERCTHQCFACTGRNGNKDPFSQCGGSCDQSKCEVPCCEGTFKIKGQWNSGQCTYQCMCAGYGQDTFQYCSGGNTCGGDCHVPCCFPLTEVTHEGRRICRHWGEALAMARFAAAEAQAAAEAAEPAAEEDGEAAGERGSAAGEGAAARSAELRAKAFALAKAAKVFEQQGPPRDPLVAAADAVAEDEEADATDSKVTSSEAIGFAKEEVETSSEATGVAED